MLKFDKMVHYPGPIMYFWSGEGLNCKNLLPVKPNIADGAHIFNI